MVVFPEQGLARGELDVLDASGFLLPQVTPQHGSVYQRMRGLKRKGLSLGSRSPHQGWSSLLG